MSKKTKKQKRTTKDVLKQINIFIGHPFHRKKFDPLHIAFILAAENSIVIFALIILSILSWPYVGLWMYLLLLSPFLFAVLWIWFTQSVLHVYKKITFHESLLIAKLSVFPFMIAMVASILIILLLVLNSSTAYILQMILFTISLSCLGSILAGLTVVLFGLRHRLRIRL